MVNTRSTKYDPDYNYSANNIKTKIKKIKKISEKKNIQYVGENEINHSNYNNIGETIINIDNNEDKFPFFYNPNTNNYINLSYVYKINQSCIWYNNGLIKYIYTIHYTNKQNTTSINTNMDFSSLIYYPKNPNIGFFDFNYNEYYPLINIKNIKIEHKPGLNFYMYTLNYFNNPSVEINSQHSDITKHFI